MKKFYGQKNNFSYAGQFVFGIFDGFDSADILRGNRHAKFFDDDIFQRTFNRDGGNRSNFFISGQKSSAQAFGRGIGTFNAVNLSRTFDNRSRAVFIF